MALTNFAALQPSAKTFWSKSTWTQALDETFLNKFLGTGTSAIFQHITDLTTTEKGTEVVMTLVGELVGDGVSGDNMREGFEEDMQAFYQTVNVDLLAHSTRSKGKLAEQKAVLSFRNMARDRLSNWMAQRLDTLALLTLSGIQYTYNTDGSPRGPSAFSSLAFAADVTPPSAKRYFTWTGTQLVAGSSATVTVDSKPNYKMIVDMVAQAKTKNIRPIIKGGKEYYMIVLQPGTLAQMKMDPLFNKGIIDGSVRGDENQWATGAIAMVDGAMLFETNKVFTTTGAPDGQKWGAGGHIEGTRTLLLGSQALGFADIEGGGTGWVEKLFNYDAQMGISLDRMFGFIKPKFQSAREKSVEDFGVIAVDHYYGLGA